jgi:drug/metabolite transporter (DMT)-like permease
LIPSHPESRWKCSQGAALFKTENQTVGVIAGILSAACFGFMATLVNRLADSIPASEITFVRGVAGVVILSAFIRSQFPLLFQKQAVSIWIRALAGAVSILCFSWNLQLADVGTANILFNLSLIFVLAVDYVTGNARPTFMAVLSVLLAVMGVALYWFGSTVIVSGEILALGLVGSTAATIAYTALNRASRKYDSWLIVWAVSLMSIPVSLLAKKGEWVIPPSSGLVMLAAIVACVLAAQYLLTVSFAKLSLPLATALGPSCIVWTVLGVAVFQSTMPTFHAILGVAVYTIGTGLMIWGSTKSSSSTPSSEP